MPSKKCPDGVICIENVTMGFICIFVFSAMYLFFKAYGSPTSSAASASASSGSTLRLRDGNHGHGHIHAPLTRMSWPYTNIPSEAARMFGFAPSPMTFNDPTRPPLNDTRYTVPLNVATNIGAVNAEYRQVGILTPANKSAKDNILSLMGRPLFTNHQKWQYYTISNQRNTVKLPISVNGKSASTEYGVDCVYSGDTVYVEGMNEPHSVTVYDTDTIRYIPL